MKLEVEPLLLIFYLSFFFLLILHIPLDHFFIKANRIDKVPSGPKVISPIWLLFQLRVALEKLDGNLAFQRAHQM